jgi:hypothetical protein
MKHLYLPLLLGMGLLSGAFAQEHELNIHGEVPLSERTDAGA